MLTTMEKQNTEIKKEAIKLISSAISTYAQLQNELLGDENSNINLIEYDNKFAKWMVYFTDSWPLEFSSLRSMIKWLDVDNQDE